MFEYKRRYIVEFNDIPKPRHKMKELPVEERIRNFSEVEQGFSEEIAQQEAKRCLACRRCLGCALCWAVCEKKAIEFSLEDKEIEIKVDSIIFAPSAEDIPPLKKEIGYKDIKNVITFLELEKMLDKEGIFKGYPLRLSDGDIPLSIGFLLESDIGYLKDLIIKQIKEIIEKLPQTKIFIILPDKVDISLHLLDSKKVIIERGIIDKIEQDDETKDVVIKFKNGKQSLNVSLFVVATEPQISSEMRQIGKSLNIPLDKYCVLEEGSELKECEKSGIFFLCKKE